MLNFFDYNHLIDFQPVRCYCVSAKAPFLAFNCFWSKIKSLLSLAKDLSHVSCEPLLSFLEHAWKLWWAARKTNRLACGSVTGEGGAATLAMTSWKWTSRSNDNVYYEASWDEEKTELEKGQGAAVKWERLEKRKMNQFSYCSWSCFSIRWKYGRTRAIYYHHFSLHSCRLSFMDGAIDFRNSFAEVSLSIARNVMKENPSRYFHLPTPPHSIFTANLFAFWCFHRREIKMEITDESSYFHVTWGI